MRIVFWGTPEYAVPTLSSLILSNHSVVAVVTQPDRRRGRGKIKSPSPIKALAIENNIQVFTPIAVNNDIEVEKHLNELNADIYIVVAFGQILPRRILDQPRLGCWNCHGSLLPRWRGAAPIQWSLISGDKYTGVAIMYMEEGIDTGPILIQERIRIDSTDNHTTLSEKLSKLSAKLMIESLAKIQATSELSSDRGIGSLKLTKQEDIQKEITYARMISKSDNYVDWNQDSIDIHRKIRGLYPNAYTHAREQRFKIYNSEIIDNNNGLCNSYTTDKDSHDINLHELDKPGAILGYIEKKGILVKTRDNIILITQAQLEGKNRVEANALIQQIEVLSINHLGCS